MISIFLNGCSFYYCNFKDKNRFYNNDLAMCQQWAKGILSGNNIPPPAPVYYPANNSGIVTAVDQYGNIYNGIYTENNNFNNTLNDINSLNYLLSSINAELAESNKVNECMFNLGWYRTTKEEYELYLTYGPPDFSQEESQQFQLILSQKFPLYPDSSQVEKSNSLHQKIRHWIYTKPETERKQLLKSYCFTKDANEYCNVLAQYKAESGDNSF